MSGVAEVEYDVATYSGTIEVGCDENDDDETVVAIAKKQLARKSGGSLPFGYQRFTVVRRWS